MESSPRYQENLARVRQLPQGTPEQEYTKRREAKLFRMEVMLDNAQCANLLTHTVIKNPDTSADEFRKIAGDSGMIAHPEILSSFINQIQFARMQVLDAQKSLEYDAKEMYHASLEETLYRWLLSPVEFRKPDWRPKGKVIIDTSHPLALTLLIEDPDDFKRIDARGNVRGFYRDAHVYGHATNDPSQHIFLDTFPLIVVKTSNRPSTITQQEWDTKYKEKTIYDTRLHEQGHGDNWLLRESVRRKGSGNRHATEKVPWVWRKNLHNEETMKALQKQFDDDREKAQGSPEWNIILHHALSRAKDELLADMNPHGGQTSYVSHLKIREGVYDYFKAVFKLDPNSSLYKELWDQYDQQLELAVQSVAQITSVYTDYSLNGRLQLFRWLLGQVPIVQWGKQLEGTLFIEEAQRLLKIEQQLKDTGSIFDGIGDFDDPNLKRYKRQMEVHKKLEKQCQDNDTKPLFPFIEEAEKALLDAA